MEGSARDGSVVKSRGLEVTTPTWYSQVHEQYAHVEHRRAEEKYQHTGEFKQDQTQEEMHSGVRLPGKSKPKTWYFSSK